MNADPIPNFRLRLEIVFGVQATLLSPPALMPARRSETKAEYYSGDRPAEVRRDFTKSVQCGSGAFGAIKSSRCQFRSNWT